MFARCLSSQKTLRVEASKVLKGPDCVYKGNKKAFVEAIRQVRTNNYLYIFVSVLELD